MKKQYFILLNLDQNDIRSEFAGFYVSDLHTNIPHGSIQITEKQWREYYNKMALDGLLLWADESNNIKTRHVFSKWDKIKKVFVEDNARIAENFKQILIIQAKQAFKNADLGRYHFDKLATAQQKRLNSYLAELEDIIIGKNVTNDKLPEVPDFLK